MKKQHTPIKDRTWMEAARRAKGFTQAEVAQAANVSTPYYNRVENGLDTPSIVIGLLICKKIEQPPERFLTERTIKS